MDSLTFRDAIERVGSTFIQVVLAFLIATPFDSVGFWDAFAVTIVVGVANAVKMLGTLWVPTFKSFLADLSYRVASTFGVTLAGFYASSTWLDLVNEDWHRDIAYAAGVSALAVLKGSLALAYRPGTITPASLVKAA
jgi:hypothetical protein